jgi:hypothetical protein
MGYLPILLELRGRKRLLIRGGGVAELGMNRTSLPEPNAGAER